MAYTKQTWTNDVTAITAERMTHIEDGIYDNSLATDKINPSGTATATAEFTDGQITDVIGFKSLKLKGQTSQYTTTGKNMLAIKQLTTQTINGVTFTPHYTGNKLDYVNVNGTATATAGYFLDNADVDNVSTYTNELPGGTYILDDFSGSSSVNTAIFFRYKTSGSTFTTINSVENSRKLTINSTFKYTSYIRINNGTTVNNMKFYPQLETGSTQTTYEPYTNGASPNPDFPQDVNNVSGDNVIAINGSKNLFDKDINIVTPGYLNASGEVVTTDATLSYQNKFINVKPNTTYTISSDTSTVYRIAEYNSSQTFISRNLNTYASKSYSFTTSNNTHYIKMAGTLTTVLNTLQIEKGNTATSYVAHQGNNFEINLGKNLIEDETFVQGSYLDNTMTIRISCRNIKLKANTTYTISSTLNYSQFNISAVTSTRQFPIPNDGYMIYNSNWKNTNFTFTTLSDDVYINIAVKKLPDGATITPNDVAGIKFQIEKGANATTHAEYFTPIEICKLGTYQDYIVKKDGKWWKHKEVGKRTLNGTENWVLESNYSRFNVQNLITDYLASERGRTLCTHYTQGDTSTEGHFGLSPSNNYLYMHYPSADVDTVAEFKEWLSSHNVSIYYVLTNSVDEEITYAPLLRQLDEVYNSGLYDETNISQDNSSEIFILDLEACKNNINGIVEYIRR